MTSRDLSHEPASQYDLLPTILLMKEIRDRFGRDVAVPMIEKYALKMAWLTEPERQQLHIEAIAFLAGANTPEGRAALGKQLRIEELERRLQQLQSAKLYLKTDVISTLAVSTASKLGMWGAHLQIDPSAARQIVDLLTWKTEDELETLKSDETADSQSGGPPAQDQPAAH